MIEPNAGTSAMLLVLNALNGMAAENNELKSCDMSAPANFLCEFEKILPSNWCFYQRLNALLVMELWLARLNDFRTCSSAFWGRFLDGWSFYFGAFG